MSLIRKSLVAVALMGVMVLVSCSYQQMVNMAEEQEITVKPNPLEVHGDSVEFDLSAVLPVNMLKKNRLYTLLTTYEYGPTESKEAYTFKDYEFPTDKVDQPSMSKKFAFKYANEMESGVLMLQGRVSNLEKSKFKSTPKLDIAKGVITTSRLVQNATYIAYADHGYNNKEELIPINVEFQFEKGSAKLRSSETKGAQGQKLDAFIAAKNTTRTVTIIGSHSPEGLESINSKLAEDRATVIKDFYFKKMKQYDYKDMADSIKFETNVVFQKWDPLLSAIDKSSSLSTDQKNQVKAIVNGAGGKSFEDTEKEISDLDFYKTLESDIYPGLRVSKTEILAVKEKKTDAEISILAKMIYEGKASADTLNFEELMYAANLTPLDDEKVKIYEAASKAHGSWKAHNNAGAIYLNKAMKETSATAKSDLIAKAAAQFDLSINKKETAIALNNKAVIELIGANKEAALNAYKKALSSSEMTPELKQGIGAGKGTAEIMHGNYETAIVSLEASDDAIENVAFNRGLSQLLMRDYENAKRAFGDAITADPKSAITYYCAAVNGARMKDDVIVQNNLTEAVKLDASLREKAAADLEFRDYWTKAAYTDAVK